MSNAIAMRCNAMKCHEIQSIVHIAIDLLLEKMGAHTMIQQGV